MIFLYILFTAFLLYVMLAGLINLAGKELIAVLERSYQLQTESRTAYLDAVEERVRNLEKEFGPGVKSLFN